MSTTTPADKVRAEFEAHHAPKFGLLPGELAAWWKDGKYLHVAQEDWVAWQAAHKAGMTRAAEICRNAQDNWSGSAGRAACGFCAEQIEGEVRHG